MYNIETKKGVVNVDFENNSLLENVNSSESEISVKCHLYFKMLNGETEEEAKNRIYEYLDSLMDNKKCPFECQIHEMEKNDI